MKKLLPIHIFIIFLLTLTLWASIFWNGTDISAWLTSLRNLTLLALSGFFIRFLIRHTFEQVPAMRFEHRIITLLILFLLFDSLNPWWLFLALGAITELCQYLLRSPLGPIFNPAALGALIMSILGYTPAWWGANPAPRFSLAGLEGSVVAWLIAVGTAYVAYRYRKLSIVWAITLTFGISYALLLAQSPLPLILDGTLLFFILVMACEPKTSPVMKKDQLVYGVIIGLLLSIGLYFHFIEASLIALLLANLYTSRKFLFQLVHLSQPKPTPQAS